MTVQTVPYALQNASHSAALFRQSASSAFRVGGALGPTELLCTQQGSPNMSVILKPGRAKVTGTSVSPPAGMTWTTQAMYDVLNDADVTLTIAASNPTNPRIDLVYIQVQDSFYSGANNQAIAGVVTGTPAASPSVPATPANSIAIATVAVAAGATSIVNANIARVASTALLVGNSAVVTNPAALAAVTPSQAGATIWMSTPGTGITALGWIAISSTLWAPLGPIYATSKANLDAFIADVAGRANQQFVVGGVSYVSGTAYWRQFSSTAGAYANGPWMQAPNTWPRVSVSKNVGQNGTTSAVAVTWNNAAADYDPTGMYSIAANTRFTVAVPGWYDITWLLQTNGTVARSTTLRLNGATSVAQAAEVGAAGAASQIVGHIALVYLAVGDYIEITVQDASAGTVIGTGVSYFAAELVVPA